MSGALSAKGNPVYRLDPRYAPAPQAVLRTGWQAVAAQLPTGPAVLAIDGPPSVDWSLLADRLEHELTGRGIVPVTLLDIRTHYAPPAHVRSRTEHPADTTDPYFRKLADNPLADLFETFPVPAPPQAGLLLVYGPGAALVEHDLLWYADVPKRYAEAAVSAGEQGANLGLPGEIPDFRRLFYIDWPMLDRHRDALAPHLDAWLDMQRPDHPAWIDGAGLRATYTALSRKPVRTRPHFNSTPWGGHWAQRELGFNPDSPNTALGYELIAARAPCAGTVQGPDRPRSRPTCRAVRSTARCGPAGHPPGARWSPVPRVPVRDRRR
jgi:hypothetical protein